MKSILKTGCVTDVDQATISRKNQANNMGASFYPVLASVVLIFGH